MDDGSAFIIDDTGRRGQTPMYRARYETTRAYLSDRLNQQTLCERDSLQAGQPISWFYGTRKCVTVFTKVCHCTFLSQINPFHTFIKAKLSRYTPRGRGDIVPTHS
jgi:hypothetical protein